MHASVYLMLKLCTLVHFVSVIVILDVKRQSSFSDQVHCSCHKSKYGKSS